MQKQLCESKSICNFSKLHLENWLVRRTDQVIVWIEFGIVLIVSVQQRISVKFVIEPTKSSLLNERRVYCVCACFVLVSQVSGLCCIVCILLARSVHSFIVFRREKKWKKKIIRRNQIDSYERVSSVRKSGSSLSANHKSFTFPSDFWRYFSNRYRVKQENNDRVTETKVICSEENI